MSPSSPIEVVRVAAGRGLAVADLAATEEPLEVRLGGRRFVVIMRTPGADFDLAAGFLLSEKIVSAPEDIAILRYCQDEDGIDTANVMSAWLTGEAAARAQRALANRRHVTANSSCGVCGRQSIEDLITGAGVIGSRLRLTRDVIATLADTLRDAQRTFDQTGGLHAAGLFDVHGRLVHHAEDVGRHNAVDKAIGAALRAGELPLGNRVLFVSGRTSFEIVQKAVVAGIPIVASVSAPSSLAIDLANASGLTLLGFVREAGFNIYTHQERIAL